MSITVNNLSFGYIKKAEILHDISFTAQEKRILVLLGPNGSGKSTILKCIDRQIDKWTGEILLADKSLKNYKRKELAKIVSYVEQDLDVTGLSVFDTILLHCYPNMVWGPGKEHYKAVNQILKELDLSYLAAKSTNSISGGERQKVAIAAALVNSPDYLLLDEPTASLDLANQLEIINLIQTIKEKRKITIIMSLHDINFALAYGDDFCLLKDGKVEIQGDKNVINAESIFHLYGVRTKKVKIDDNSYIINI